MKLFLLWFLLLSWRSTRGEEEEAHVDSVERETNENGEGTTEVFEQQPPDDTDMAHSFATDSIEILGLPTQATPSFRSKISYITAGPRILHVDVFAVGVDRLKPFYHTEWTDISDYGETRLKIVKVHLPDQLIYREDKAMNIFPDLHSEYILVRASIVDYNNPSALIQHVEQSLKLIPPWRRMEKKGYSCSWKAFVLKKCSESRIPQCRKVDDIVELLAFPAAMVESEHGYKTFLEKLLQPEEEHLEEDPNVIPQFTLTTWLYLTKGCSNDMCPLMHHIRGGAYLTPLVGLLKSGYFHVQVHYEDGSGYAFLVDPQLPLNKWVHIAMTVKGTVVTLCIRHGKTLQHSKVFVHTDFPGGLFHYNDTDGYWLLGGSPGFASPQGFIGPARIYRRRVLSIETIEKLFTPASKPNLGISNYYRNCRRLKSEVKRLLKKQNTERNICPVRQWSSSSRNLNCRVGVSGIASEIVNISEIWQNTTGRVGKLQDNVHNYAVNMIKTSGSHVKEALNFLLYSSCLGHYPSLYVTAVIYGTGFKTNMDSRAAKRALLIGALNNHPLSQMSLAYKHLIGVDGFPEDCEVAQTYYRHAADQSNELLSQHNEVHTHSEAVRLDKKKDLDEYRGPNSNWFNWLKNQATQGITGAQSVLGEVFYYGARGFRRNLTKAAEFYEMGAKRGDAQMLFNLGVVKLRGQGVTVNEDEARDLLTKSADLGFASAFNALGYYELHVRKNKSGAVHYFKHAAEHDDRDGLFNMAFAHEHGLAPNSTPDLKLAMPYYINAASKGHPGGCIVAGDAFSKGNHVERNTPLALVYFKFVADQIPEMGTYLRNGLEEYFNGAWHTSMLDYLLAAEAGMEVAQYNVALLCEWDWERISKNTEVDCVWRYYNHSAKLQWTPSLIKTGDNYWYGITFEKNITAAAQLYSKAAAKEQNPQAIYNLGYLVENNYTLDGIKWLHFDLSHFNQGNLSLAAVLYRKCRDSSDEALLPCSLGLLRVAVKMAWQFQLVNNEVLLIPSVVFVMVIGLLICICRINGGHETIDVA